MYLSNNLKIRVKIRCRGPASAGCRGTLRMNRVERERERKRQRERPDWRVQQGLAMLWFSPYPLYPKLVHF